jgi:hypothetical protein
LIINNKTKKDYLFIFKHQNPFRYAQNAGFYMKHFLDGACPQTPWKIQESRNIDGKVSDLNKILHALAE